MISSEFALKDEQGGGGTSAEVLDQSSFKSRKGALVWFFKKSRDNWKAKYSRIKSEEAKLRKRVSYLVLEREKEQALIASLSERCAKLQEELAIAQTANAKMQAKSELLEADRNTLFF